MTVAQEPSTPFEMPLSVLGQSTDAPPLAHINGSIAPEAPKSLDATGVDASVLGDLALKLATTVPSFSSEWAAQQMHLPLSLIEDLYWNLKQGQLIDILGHSGPLSYRYAITQRGMEHARRMLDVSGYIGPAPVSLKWYTAMLERQLSERKRVEYDDVRRVLSPLVLPESSVQISALAAASGRSLFLFGPSGNGKTSMGRLLHEASQGELWIPYCINIDSQIIRIYDPQCHQLADEAADAQPGVDQRWVKIRRPLIVAGGEMTLRDLDLTYVPSVRYYEAPGHLKANGGTFLIDDFGRQHVDPTDLLNRWIVPMEHEMDHLTLHTGQKIHVPFRLMLIVATNLSVDDVADPAFLRRLGYRLHLDRPTPENYGHIFQRYAAQYDMTVSQEVLSKLLARYQSENRELRASEPRDLIERARDICRLEQKPFELGPDVLDTAWRGYFGQYDAAN